MTYKQDPVRHVYALLRTLVLLTALVVALLFYIAVAKAETVLSEGIVGQGGLICNIPEEVEAYISYAEEGVSPQDALNSIEGCGILIKPALFKVTAISVFTTKKAKYLIVRYNFLSVPVEQFGIHSIILLGEEM